MIFFLEASTNSVNWTTISISILGSIGTAILAAIATIRLKTVDFKFDYKKYILKKRIEAYEKIRPVIVRLNIHYLITEGSNTGKEVHDIFKVHQDKDSLYEYLTLLRTTAEYNVFYSDEFYLLLSDLNELLENALNDVRNSKNTEAMENLALEFFPKLRVVRRSLLSQYFSDITRLDNIEAFKNKKIHR